MTRIVGLLPAAGRAQRFAPEGFEKELLPIVRTERSGEADTARAPKLVIEFVVDGMLLAGVSEFVVVTSPAKVGRLAEHLCNRYAAVANIAFLAVRDSPSMVHSLAASGPWLRDADVAMGMPDSIPLPVDSFAQLVRFHREEGGHLSLGLFRTPTPERFGMVEVGHDGRIVSHADKPVSWTGGLMWGMAVWAPAFTEFLANTVLSPAENESELPLGSVIDRALEGGLIVKGHEVIGGAYHDVGTFKHYRQAVIEL
jgi:glucose-1-phosphate thymidylyltransferase